MLAFGGAGPLNACGVAEKAGIRSVAIPKMAAVFSAYGIGACDISQRYCVSLTGHDTATVRALYEDLKQKARRDMFAEGFAEGEYAAEARLVAEFDDGTEADSAINGVVTFPAEFASARSVDLEVRAVKTLRDGGQQGNVFRRRAQARASGTRTVLSRDDSRRTVPVYALAQLKPGDWAEGPAILEEDFFTCRVLPGWRFVISDAGDVLINAKD